MVSKTTLREAEKWKQEINVYVMSVPNKIPRTQSSASSVPVIKWRKKELTCEITQFVTNVRSDTSMLTSLITGV